MSCVNQQMHTRKERIMENCERKVWKKKNEEKNCSLNWNELLGNK